MVRLGDGIEGNVICAETALGVIAVRVFLKGENKVGDVIDSFICGINRAGDVVGNEFLCHGASNLLFGFGMSAGGGDDRVCGGGVDAEGPAGTGIAWEVGDRVGEGGFVGGEHRGEIVELLGRDGRVLGLFPQVFRVTRDLGRGLRVGTVWGVAVDVESGGSHGSSGQWGWGCGMGVGDHPPPSTGRG